MDKTGSYLDHCCVFACDGPIIVLPQTSSDNLASNTCAKNCFRFSFCAFFHDDSNFSEFFNYNTFDNKEILPLNRQHSHNDRTDIDDLRIRAPLSYDWSILHYQSL